MSVLEPTGSSRLRGDGGDGGVGGNGMRVGWHGGYRGSPGVLGERGGGVRANNSCQRLVQT